jgi:hypothetical protein
MPVVVANVSDVHAGSTVALCPPGPIDLDDGGAYVPSKAQTWLWQCWRDYWDRVAQAQDRARAELYIIYNGDLFEGDHHQTSQIISRNPTVEAELVRKILEVPGSLGAAKTFVVRGTEAHVGGSGSKEEGLAGTLGAVPDPSTGRKSWWHLRADIEGVYLDVAHHGRTGHREHTRGNAAILHAHDIFLSHTKRGDRPPDLCLRAHYHRFNDSYDHCPTRVVTTGAFQLKTGFVHKVAADTMADVGGVIVTVGDGVYELAKVQFRPERGPVWTAVA